MGEPYKNELMHYGVLGQKWGIRRYQNPDGTLTEAGKKRYGTVENLEAGRTQRQTKRYEKKKKEAIRSGSATEISKYSKDLSPDEFSQALNRINMEQTLANLRAKEVSAGEAVANSIVKKAENWGGIYNTFAKFYNMSHRNSKLPIFGDPENNKVKKISADEQTKIYNLEQTKKKDERAAEFENILRTKGYDYIKNHQNEFSYSELGDAIKREERIKSMGKESTNKSNSNSSEYHEPSQEIRSSEKPKTNFNPSDYHEPSQ